MKKEKKAQTAIFCIFLLCRLRNKTSLPNKSQQITRFHWKVVRWFPEAVSRYFPKNVWRIIQQEFAHFQKLFWRIEKVFLPWQSWHWRGDEKFLLDVVSKNVPGYESTILVWQEISTLCCWEHGRNFAVWGHSWKTGLISKENIP